MINALRKLLGPEAVNDISGAPAVVIQDEATARALAAFARDRGWKLRAWSGRGAPSSPPPGGVILVAASRALGGEVTLAAADGYVEVAAATAWLELQETLAPSRLWFPYVTPACREATLGELIARAPANALAPLYGELPRFILGLWFIADDGALVHTGRRTIKGVTGYNLAALFTGTRGRNGLITRVRLRLEPRPRRAALWRVKNPPAPGAAVDRLCRAPMPGGYLVYAEVATTPASLATVAAGAGVPPTKLAEGDAATAAFVRVVAESASAPAPPGGADLHVSGLFV